jgi:hypothetical protein
MQRTALRTDARPSSFNWHPHALIASILFVGLLLAVITHPAPLDPATVDASALALLAP